MPELASDKFGHSKAAPSLLAEACEAGPARPAGLAEAACRRHDRAAVQEQCDPTMRAMNIPSAAALLVALAIPGMASAGGSSCDELDAIAETPAIDYETQIQPIWAIRCANCHYNHSGTPAAGLDLNQDESWFSLYLAASQQLQDVRLAVPGDVDASYLFEKINCEIPRAGLRMPRGRTALPLAEQALIRDWIRQGALDAPALFADGFEAATTP
jgi:hypothetical protein